MIFNRNTGFTAQETALIKKRLNEFEDASFKDTVEGNSINLDDVSPLTHTVKIKLRSTNLFEPMEGSGSEAGVSWSQNINKTIALRGTATGDAYPTLGRIHLEAGKPYILSGADTGTQLQMMVDGVWKYDTGTGILFRPAKDQDVNVLFKIANKTNYEGKTLKPMIIKGTVGQRYTPYRAYRPDWWTVIVDGTTYTAEPDGNVYGVESRSPNMTFTAGDFGLTMEVTYIHDINTWLHKLKDLVGEL